MSNKRIQGKSIDDKGRNLIFKFNEKKDCPIILKIFVGTNPWKRSRLEREKVALTYLKGLAIPKKVVMIRKRVERLVKSKAFSFVAIEWLPWRSASQRSFDTDQALGLWAFTLEQLCAFRRNKILYIDVKAEHLLVSEELDEARIIDFDSCIMLEPRGVYPTNIISLGFTPEVAAPEIFFDHFHTERVIVYQVGMLLGGFLFNNFKNMDVHSKPMARIKKKLIKVQLGNLYTLMEQCVSKKPSERPKDLEQLFARVQKLKLPATSLNYWIKLRAPYRKRLAELGLGDPIKLEKPGSKAA